MRFRLLVLGTVLTAGCALSHTIGDRRAPDSGPPHDVEPDAAVSCGDLWSPSCFMSCDTVTSAVCTPSGWACPPGSSTSPPSSCCSPGRPPPEPGCVCDGWTWSCGSPDAGIFSCPADPSTLLGAACGASLEGVTCGTCDPCGPCNQAACTSGTWVMPPEIELPCLPETTFVCGTTRCVSGTQVCEIFRSDTPPSPDVYECAAYPSGCSPATGCGCFSVPPSLCHDDGVGGVTVDVPTGG